LEDGVLCGRLPAFACDPQKLRAALAAHLKEVERSEPAVADLQIQESLDATIAPFRASPGASRDEARMALLYELPLRFGKGGNWNAVLRETVEKLVEVMPEATHAALLVQHRSDGKLHLDAHFPLGKPGVSDTLAQRVLTTKEACLWVRGQQDLTASLESMGLQCGIYAPMMWEDKALGVACIGSSKSPKAFGKAELKLIVALAHHAAMALANQA